MTLPIQSILRDLLRKRGWESALRKEQMPRYWAELVGARIASISEVRSFENGVLRIHVKDASWRTEIMLRREDLRHQLNERIGEPVVNEIIVR
jgi:predicted nucleic acid-binding Zn ribbon protein